MSGAHRPPGSPPNSGLPIDTTASLLARVRAGDLAARERLIGRYLGPLKRWAHGRLPVRARDLFDTDDVVQNTLIRSLDHMEAFEARQEGAFLAYLRRVLVNQIRDEIRRAGRQPGRDSLSEMSPAPGPSPLEVAIGRERLEQYEAALAALPDAQQEAIFMRVELGFTYDEIAGALGIPSENAARMMVVRALIRLEEGMNARR